MGLKSKILNLLKEEEEEEDIPNLFAPRIKRRIDNSTGTDKRMLTEFTKGAKIKVLIRDTEKFIEGKIDEEPEYNEFENIAEWTCTCLLYVKKEDVGPGEHYGIYRGACTWN